MLLLYITLAFVAGVGIGVAFYPCHHQNHVYAGGRRYELAKCRRCFPRRRRIRVLFDGACEVGTYDAWADEVRAKHAANG